MGGWDGDEAELPGLTTGDTGRVLPGTRRADSLRRSVPVNLINI